MTTNPKPSISMAALQKFVDIVLSDRQITIESYSVSEFFEYCTGLGVRCHSHYTKDPGRFCDIIIQMDSYDDLASYQTARQNSDALDDDNSKYCYTPEDLPDTYVILISSRSALGADAPIRYVNKYLYLSSDDKLQPIDNGSYILYLNLNYRNTDSAIGKLISDFRDPNPETMFYKEFASIITARRKD